MSIYLPTIAWGAIAKNIAVYYDSGAFVLNEYTIEVYPLDINEPGASILACDVGDYFIDFLGWPWIVKEITELPHALRLRLYDVNERSISEQVNYGPYPEKIGYVYKPTRGKIIFSQAQLIKLDTQARDRINNIEKGIEDGGGDSGCGCIFFDGGRTNEVYLFEDTIECGTPDDIQNTYIDCGESIRTL